VVSWVFAGVDEMHSKKARLGEARGHVCTLLPYVSHCQFESAITMIEETSGVTLEAFFRCHCCVYSSNMLRVFRNSTPQRDVLYTFSESKFLKIIEHHTNGT